MSKARKVVQNWEYEHTHNERLVEMVAFALDDAGKSVKEDHK